MLIEHPKYSDETNAQDKAIGTIHNPNSMRFELGS